MRLNVILAMRTLLCTERTIGFLKERFGEPNKYGTIKCDFNVSLDEWQKLSAELAGVGLRPWVGSIDHLPTGDYYWLAIRRHYSEAESLEAELARFSPWHYASPDYASYRENPSSLPVVVGGTIGHEHIEGCPIGIGRVVDRLLMISAAHKEALEDYNLNLKFEPMQFVDPWDVPLDVDTNLYWDPTVDPMPYYFLIPTVTLPPALNKIGLMDFEDPLGPGVVNGDIRYRRKDLEAVGQFDLAVAAEEVEFLRTYGRQVVFVTSKRFRQACHEIGIFNKVCIESLATLHCPCIIEED
jgi:hypothetical protein